MQVYFGGGEAPTLRRRLLDAGARNIVVNYYSLRQRNLASYDLSRLVPADVRIILYPGLTAAWAQPDKHTAKEWAEYAAEYHETVALNVDRIDFAVEFAFGSMEFIEHNRRDFWLDIDQTKFGAVLLPGQPPVEVCESYPQVVVPSLALDSEEAETSLRAAVRRHDTRWHLMGSTDQDLLARLQPNTLSTTTWTSPARYGEWVMWDGHRLRRTKDADEVRRMRNIVSALGCDPKKASDGDPDEASRLAIVSIQHMVERLSPGDVPDTNAPRRTPRTEPSDPTAPATTSVVPATDGPTEEPVTPSDGRQTLPIMAAFRKRADGVSSEVMTRSDDAQLRRCDGCSLAAWCPEYTPGNGCAYAIPAEIRTHEQLVAAGQTLLEAQMKRSMFALFAEEVQGGMPTKTASVEMDRFFKMAERLKTMQEDGAYVKITAEARGGGGGVLSSLFGAPPPAVDPGTAETIIGEVVRD